MMFRNVYILMVSMSCLVVLLIRLILSCEISKMFSYIGQCASCISTICGALCFVKERKNVGCFDETDVSFSTDNGEESERDTTTFSTCTASREAILSQPKKLSSAGISKASAYTTTPSGTEQEKSVFVEVSMACPLRLCARSTHVMAPTSRLEGETKSVPLQLDLSSSMRSVSGNKIKMSKSVPAITDMIQRRKRPRAHNGIGNNLGCFNDTLPEKHVSRSAAKIHYDGQSGDFKQSVKTQAERVLRKSEHAPSHEAFSQPCFSTDSFASFPFVRLLQPGSFRYYRNPTNKMIYPVGSGTSAHVFKGFLCEDEVEVCVKLFHVKSLKHSVLEYFMHVILQNTGFVPRIHGMLVDKDKLNNDRYGIVMDYVADGVTLRHLLRTGHPLPEVTWITILVQIAKGVQLVHSTNVLLNDIKNDNVMVDVSRANQVKVFLIDFGLATVAKGNRFRPVKDAEHRRKRAHLAPEALDGKATSVACDTYSLGKIMADIYATARVTDTRKYLSGVKYYAKLAMSRKPAKRPLLTDLYHCLVVLEECALRDNG